MSFKSEEKVYKIRNVEIKDNLYDFYKLLNALEIYQNKIFVSNIATTYLMSFSISCSITMAACIPILYIITIQTSYQFTWNKTFVHNLQRLRLTPN